MGCACSSSSKDDPADEESGKAAPVAPVRKPSSKEGTGAGSGSHQERETLLGEDSESAGRGKAPETPGASGGPPRKKKAAPPKHSAASFKRKKRKKAREFERRKAHEAEQKKIAFDVQARRRQLLRQASQDERDKKLLLKQAGNVASVGDALAKFKAMGVRVPLPASQSRRNLMWSPSIRRDSETPLSLRESLEAATDASDRATKRRRSLWRRGKNLALLEHESQVAQRLKEQRERTGKQGLWTEDELDDIWDVLEPAGMRDRVAGSTPVDYLAPAWRRLKQASPEIFAQRAAGPPRCKVGATSVAAAAPRQATVAALDHGAGVGAVTSSTRALATPGAAAEAAAEASESDVGGLSDTASDEEAASVGASLTAALVFLGALEQSSASPITHYAEPQSSRQEAECELAQSSSAEAQPVAVAGAQPAAEPTAEPRMLTVTITKGGAGFGLGLDAQNVVTELKPGTPARGLVQVGDRVISLNGVAVSADHPVNSVAVSLANGASGTFLLRRDAAPADPAGRSPTPQPQATRRARPVCSGLVGRGVVGGGKRERGRLQV